MKMMKKAKHRKIESIVVTDLNGKSWKYESAAAAAAALDVTRPYVYIALRNRRKIRGCIVEAVYAMTDDEAYFAQ